MARLVLPVAFAAAGSIIPGVGWQAGWLVGSVASSLLFKQGGGGREGPRLSDQLVSSSAEGAPIAIGYGALRMPGNMIWSDGITETANRRGGGKGMGGSASTTEYTYSASFALGFAEGEARRLLRVWADGKLIFDATPESEEIEIEGLQLRFYRGTETQLADPLIAAVEGAARTPAFRGLCYLVLEDLQLADYGNRLPQITAEIAFRDVGAQRTDDFVDIAEGDGGVFDPQTPASERLAVDWPRRRGWLVAGTGTGLRRFGLRSMAEERQAAAADLFTGATGTIRALTTGPDGDVWLSLLSNILMRVSGSTLRETARLTGVATAFRAMLAQRFIGETGIFDYVATLEDSIVAVVSADPLRLSGTAGLSDLGRHLLPEGERGFWVVSVDLDGVRFRKASVFSVAFQLSGGGDAPPLIVDLVEEIAPDALNAPASFIDIDSTGAVRDEADGGLIVTVRTLGAAPGAALWVVFKWREGDGIVWRTTFDVSVSIAPHETGQDRVNRGVFTFIRGSESVEIDTATGEVIGTDTWTGPAPAQCVYDARSDSMIQAYAQASGTDPTSLRRRYFNRSSAEGNTTGEIVADICARAGLAAEDLDVTELTDSVPGYVIGRQTSARAAIEPLGAAFFFDGVESDDKLAFRARGRAPVAALDAELLVPLEDGATWRTTRAQEVELPARVTVVAMNRGQGYRQMAQTAKRAEAPLAAMESREQATVELPMALSAQRAKRIAESMLWSAWAGRDEYQGRLPRDYLRLDPTDVVTLTLPGGAAFRARITGLPIGADLTLSLSAVSEEPATYASVVEAGEGEGYEEVGIPGPAASRLFLPQIPLLRDEDSPPAGTSRVYFAAAGHGGAWPGAAIFRGPDLVEWERVAATRRAPGVAGLTAALAQTRSPWTWDRENALEIALDSGEEPESVTDLQLLNGANAALVFRPSGEAEILQYRDAEETGPGRWRLTTLLRGRRGSEVFAREAHAAGAACLLIAAGGVGLASIAAAEIDALRYWRAVGRGQGFDEGETVSAAHRGHDLRPWAPVHLAAALDGADIDLTWVRRTRLNGGLRGGTGIVPLQEATEAYEVDILDGPGGAVLRTLEVTAPAATYLAADIATDFGSTPSSLSVAIHQISAEAGRGFAALATLEIA